MYSIGISYKFVKIIEAIYTDTKSAVWNGEELSEYFQTNSGVKQGCLLSPLLFSLYINDLHDNLGGGMNIDNINIRLLMYADDIVILADEVDTLQKMIANSEVYCDLWNLEVRVIDIQKWWQSQIPRKMDIQRILNKHNQPVYLS